MFACANPNRLKTIAVTPWPIQKMVSLDAMLPHFTFARQPDHQCAARVVLPREPAMIYPLMMAKNAQPVIASGRFFRIVVFKDATSHSAA